MSEATLYINLWDSQCSNCNRHCNPRETHYFTLLGYGVKEGEEGCGAEFTSLSSHYMGELVQIQAKYMRPDLPWTGLFLG